MKMLIILVGLCIAFPGLRILIINGLIGFLPLIEALMPCLIVISGIYLIVKSVMR